MPGTTSDLQRLGPQETDKLPAGPVWQGSGRESPQEEEEEQAGGGKGEPGTPSQNRGHFGWVLKEELLVLGTDGTILQETDYPTRSEE